MFALFSFVRFCFHVLLCRPVPARTDSTHNTPISPFLLGVIGKLPIPTPTGGPVLTSFAIVFFRTTSTTTRSTKSTIVWWWWWHELHIVVLRSCSCPCCSCCCHWRTVVFVITLYCCVLFFVSLFLFLLLLLLLVVCSHRLLLLCCCRRCVCRHLLATVLPFLLLSRCIVVSRCFALFRIVVLFHLTFNLLSSTPIFWLVFQSKFGPTSRARRNENDVPPWSTAQEEKEGRGYEHKLKNLFFCLFYWRFCLFWRPCVSRCVSPPRPTSLFTRPSTRTPQGSVGRVSVIGATLPLRRALRHMLTYFELLRET